MTVRKATPAEINRVFEEARRRIGRTLTWEEVQGLDAELAREIERDHTVRTPLTRCENCGHSLNAATDTEALPSVPAEGDISICIECMAVSVFRADLSLRQITDREWLDLTLEERTAVQRAQDQLIQIKCNCK